MIDGYAPPTGNQFHEVRASKARGIIRGTLEKQISDKEHHIFINDADPQGNKKLVKTVKIDIDKD